MIPAHVPHWLSLPAGAVSILAALAGSGLILHAAAFGSVGSAVWSGVAFLVAAAAWWVGDAAAGNRPL